MGQPALFPFKLTPAVIAKLSFVHERIETVRCMASSDSDADILKAVITGLRQKVAAPNA
jgi:hypothetical protein